MTYIEDNQELIEQIQSILEEDSIEENIDDKNLSEATKIEHRVVDGINELFKNTVIHAQFVGNNKYSDVLITREDDKQKKWYVEVKLDSNAPIGKYNCQFNSNSGFEIDFNRLRKQEVSTEIFDSTRKEIVQNVKGIINEEIREKVTNNLKSIMFQINLLMKDNLQGKRGSFFTRRGQIRKGFDFDESEFKVTDIQFPKFFNKLRDFFDAINKEDQERYITIRNEIRTKVNEEYVEQFDEIILENLNDNSIERIGKAVEFIENSVGEDKNIFKDEESVKNLVSELKDIYIKYHNLLQDIESENDTSRTIGQLEPIERTCYTYKYFIEATDKNEIRIEYVRNEDIKYKSFSIQRQRFHRDSEEFSRLLNSVIRYYRNFDNVAYIQIGNHVMNLDSSNKEEYDPLKIANIIGDFREYYDDLDFDLRVVSIVGKTQNMQLRLYINGVNSNDVPEYSLALGDENMITLYDLNGEKDKRIVDEESKEIEEHIEKILNESLENENLEEGMETSKTEANKFELEVTDSLRNFLHAQKSPYNSLEVEHYEEPDLKYWSDIKVTNPKNNKRFWVEAKENKYSCLGSTSMVFKEGKWTCSTLEDNDPLVNDLLNAINENSKEFVQFCKDYLGTEDITLPKDITEDLVESWRNSGKITDTDNTVLFITNKIPLENFGEKIASFYKNSKNEPAYYIQIGDDLYLVDKNTNVLNLRTKDGQQLKTLSEVYKLGRIQFRLKRYNRPQKIYYSIYEDVKILADEDNVIEDYNCSFLSQEKWPVIVENTKEVPTGKTQEMQVDADQEEIKEQFEDICKEDTQNKQNARMKHFEQYRFDDTAFEKCAERMLNNLKNKSLRECIGEEEVYYLCDSIIKTYPTKKFLEKLIKRFYGALGLSAHVAFVENDGYRIEYDGKGISYGDSDFEDKFEFQAYSTNKEGDIDGTLEFSFKVDVEKSKNIQNEEFMSKMIEDCHYFGYDMVNYTVQNMGSLVEFHFMFESKYQPNDININKKLYHLSPFRNNEKILQKGIFPKSDSENDGLKLNHEPRTYLFNRYDEGLFRKFLVRLGKKNETHVMGQVFSRDEIFGIYEIDTDKVNNLHFYRDNMFYTKDIKDPIALYVYETIPPTAIKLVGKIDLKGNVQEENEQEIKEQFEDICREENIEENLTIPQNENDEIEKELYKNLEKNYDHADRIVRWYRNAKKSGVEEKDLKKTFIENLDNIKDLFKTYEKYIESLKKMKMLNKKVEINGKQFDVVKDVDKLRMLSGFQSLVKAMGDEVNSGTAIETSEEKYAITDEDRKKIRILGFTENVVCWCTEGYETTNKFIFQLWQNSKTLGRGDVYGDPSEQTPYCTHSREHWNDYSEGFDRYQQFWFLKRVELLDGDDISNASERILSQLKIKKGDESFVQKNNDMFKHINFSRENIKYTEGDLNNPEVVKVFNIMRGTGPETIIAMNDSGNDFLDREDEHFYKFSDLGWMGNEVQELNDAIFVRQDYQEFTIGGRKIKFQSEHQNDMNVIPKSDLGNGEMTDTRKGDLILNHSIGELDNLIGCPRLVKKGFEVSEQNKLENLKGSPERVGRSMFVQDNNELKSIEGCPKFVGRDFYIMRNGKLTSLDNLPYEINGYRITVGQNDKLQHLGNFPKNFKNNIEIQENALIDLNGCPQILQEFKVNGEQNIESLAGGPSKVISLGISDCKNLISLDGAPKYAQYVDVSNTGLSKEQIENYIRFTKVRSVIDILGKYEDEWTKKIVNANRMYYEEHLMEDGEHYKEDGISLKEAMKACGLVEKEANSAITTIDNTNIKNVNEEDETEIKEQYEKICSEENAEGFGGNCGIWALEKAKEYLKDGHQVEIVFCTEVPMEEMEALFNQDAKLYHVAIMIDHDMNQMYDASGKIDVQYLKDFCDQEYGNDDPEIWTLEYRGTKDKEDLEIEKIIRDCTNWKIYENVVDDTVSDMKKNKSTNEQNPDTKMIKNISGSETLTLVSSLDGRLILVNPEGETVRRDDGQQLYFDDKMDAVKWTEDRNYKIDSSIEDDGLQESEQNDVKTLSLLTNVPEDNIKNILDTSTIENKRFEKIQFEKYYGQNYNWACLMNSEECLAMACLKEDEPFNSYVYIAEIQTLKKGYGRYLIEELINKYGKVWFMANTKAGESLINYYRNLNLQEITIKNSVYECTAYFFCTKDCDYDKLENYLIAFYSNEEDLEEIDEKRKFDVRLKDKDKTYKPEVNNYAFKNKSEKYGGDDYLTTDEIIDHINPNMSAKGVDNWFKGLENLKQENSKIYARIDDGKDSKLAIVGLKKSQKNPRIAYVLTSQDGEGMKTADFGRKLSEMMYFMGRLIKGRLVIMNENDESVYVCNGMRAEGNDVVLEFEWGDITEYSQELSEAEEEIGGEKSDIANVVQGDKIWIDDIREAPEGFKWFKTVRQFIKYIDEHGTDNIALIDTDHDAGDYQKFGGDYIRCIDYLDFIGAKNVTIHIHSANPVGANNIRRIISKNKEEKGWKEVRNTEPKTEKSDSEEKVESL